ncbi:Transcriptional regulator PadR-like family protein [Candidatus Gugararchaeum adminiculabundum]|nr:Transcriptional regulator PadR-like family protein [Candidatus Gugararchaeum adminiculabundum]
MKQGKDSKAMERLRTALTTGNMWLCVLSLCEQQKKIYAYGLREDIEKKWGWKPSMIMSYLVLYKIEKDGLIKSEFEERRKYYTITPRGKEELKKAKGYLASLSKGL